MILPTEMGQQSVNVSMKKKEEEETLFDPKSTNVQYITYQIWNLKQYAHACMDTCA